MTSCLNGLALEGETVREMRRKVKSSNAGYPHFSVLDSPSLLVFFSVLSFSGLNLLFISCRHHVNLRSSTLLCTHEPVRKKASAKIVSIPRSSHTGRYPPPRECLRAST